MAEDELPIKRGLSGRLAEAVLRMDEEPRFVTVARLLRRRLPGDSDFGDPLSLGGTKPSEVVARRLAETGAWRPSAARELGLAAVQVWQALSEAQGRGHGDEAVAILFTDLVDFSAWALDVGDDTALELLRQVAGAVEPAIAEHGGFVVKRLGDGVMAVFVKASNAVAAAHAAVAAVEHIEVDGHRPRLRAGVHCGRPRRLGGDYYGVDVNIAARVAAAASAGEVLISETARDGLDPDAFKLKRQRWFRAKGAPRDLEVFAAEPV